MEIPWILVLLISIHFTTKCLCYTLFLSKNEEEPSNRLDIEDDVRDSRERSDWRRPDTDQDDTEDARFKGWNYIDTSKEWVPHKKTISLQVLDDQPYYHGGRPSWPNDQYLYSPFYGHPTRNGSENSSTLNDPNRLYEWQRLPFRYDYYGNPYPVQQVPETNKLETTDAQGTTSISDQRHHPYIYGNYHNPYYGNEYRGTRRFRFQIHPGLIAAPLAGLAAYKAASAFNPLLVELGLIDKGRGQGWGSFLPSFSNNYPNYPSYPPPVVPPVYPPPYTPPLTSLAPYGPSQAHANSHSPYPILIPGRNTNVEKSSWWNPFSVLTPRS